MQLILTQIFPFIRGSSRWFLAPGLHLHGTLLTGPMDTGTVTIRTSHKMNVLCRPLTVFRPRPKRLGAYRFGVSVCPSYFFVRARTFERKVIETWL